MYVEHHNPNNVWGSSATVVSSMLQVECILHPILHASNFVNLMFVGHSQNQLQQQSQGMYLCGAQSCNVCCSSATVSHLYVAGEVYTILKSELQGL